MIKEHELYKYYLYYIEHKIENRKLTIGGANLLKISNSYFKNFENEYNKNESFREMINEICKKSNRDDKIESLLNGYNK